MAKCAVDEFRIAILARRLENCPVRCPPPITLACDKVKASLAIFTGAKIEERVDEPGRHRELPALSGTVRVIIIDLYQISVDERAPNGLCLTRAAGEVHGFAGDELLLHPVVRLAPPGEGIRVAALVAPVQRDGLGAVPR